MSTSTAALTSHERWLIVRARQLVPELTGGIRDQLAGQLLRELADLAERLGESGHG